MFFQKVKGFEFGTSAPQSRGTSGGRRSRGCVRLKEELLVPQQSLLSQDKATVSFKAAALLEQSCIPPVGPLVFVPACVIVVGQPPISLWMRWNRSDANHWGLGRQLFLDWKMKAQSGRRFPKPMPRICIGIFP